MDCSACARVAAIAERKNPDYVATLSESHVTLADEHAYPGYCILLLKDHHDHVDQLPIERQLRLWEDVTRVATVLRRELEPVRINYACLGNFVTHVHWHVIPRYRDDPEPHHPIWVRPVAERRIAMPEPARQQLIGRLRAALAR
jgi:diadenosine tetraphosphate (Ap4A) HIT family hydrolase